MDDVSCSLFGQEEKTLMGVMMNCQHALPQNVHGVWMGYGRTTILKTKKNIYMYIYNSPCKHPCWAQRRHTGSCSATGSISQGASFSVVLGTWSEKQWAGRPFSWRVGKYLEKNGITLWNTYYTWLVSMGMGRTRHLWEQLRCSHWQRATPRWSKIYQAQLSA
jgi:hypothetical protein